MRTGAQRPPRTRHAALGIRSSAATRVNDSEASLANAATDSVRSAASLFPAGLDVGDLAAGSETLLLGVALAVLALSGAALFSLLRVALMRSVPGRVLAPVTDDDARARLARQLSSVETLVASAGTLRVACELAFVLLVLGLAAGSEPLDARSLGIAAGVGVPLLVLAVEVLPQALVETSGDAVLRRWLGVFHLVQLPIMPLSRLFARLRSFTSRRSGGRGHVDATRRIVEDLREAVQESDLETELDENEREIIENVMEFHDVDVAAIMTPRTEIESVDLAWDLRRAIVAASACGHGRLPVCRDGLDDVVGIFSARDALDLVAQERVDDAELASIVRPTMFVPETKRVSELLEEFRRQRSKVAIVVDEYGGTAGLVTMADVLAELVGDIQDEFDDTEEVDEIVRTSETTATVQAVARVSEVNEELDLDLPEEGDYETIAGFVLAQLGRFPATGEAVVHEGVRLTVTNANERRVLELELSWTPVAAAPRRD